MFQRVLTWNETVTKLHIQTLYVHSVHVCLNWIANQNTQTKEVENQINERPNATMESTELTESTDTGCRLISLRFEWKREKKRRMEVVQQVSIQYKQCQHEQTTFMLAAIKWMRCASGVLVFYTELMMILCNRKLTTTLPGNWLQLCKPSIIQYSAFDANGIRQFDAQLVAVVLMMVVAANQWIYPILHYSYRYFILADRQESTYGKSTFYVHSLPVPPYWIVIQLNH